MSVHPKRIFTRLTFRQPPQPEIVSACKKLQEKGNASVSETVHVVSRDPVTSVHILKRANNAYYGMQGHVSSLTHAVEILGVSPVLNLVTSETASPSDNLPLFLTMQHGFATAQISHRLVHDQWLWAPEQQASAGGIFTAGLTHNLGRLAICQSFPDEAKMLYGFSDVSFPVSGPLRELEQLQFGADYIEIGAFIGMKYRFAPDLLDVIQHHDDPSGLKDSSPSFKLALTVNAAAEIATSLGYGMDPQGSLLQPEHSPGLHWYEANYPGKVLKVISESEEYLLSRDIENLEQMISDQHHSNMSSDRPPVSHAKPSSKATIRRDTNSFKN